MAKIKPNHVHLICNAKYHDTDFARSELVKLFSEHDRPESINPCEEI